MPKSAFVRVALAALTLLAAGSSHAQLYWRVDGGWSMSTDAKIRDNNFAADGIICADPACSSGTELNEVGNSPVIQGGLGWRFNQNFRIDGILGYRGGYELDDSDAFPSDYRADISSWSLMANAYWDIPLAWGKPYVGAGIGVASNKIGTITNSGSGFSFTVPGGTSTGLAWSLTAGIGISITPALTLDVGYRYIDLGDIESDAIPGYSGLTGKLRAHELMVGVRF
jgi:opacity protein-like surface antigen